MGRRRWSGLFISDAPVGFKSKVVSRKHCEFGFLDGQWQMDGNSTVQRAREPPAPQSPRPTTSSQDSKAAKAMSFASQASR
jgi:hypothetical protein